MFKKLTLLFLGLLLFGMLVILGYYRVDGIPIAASEQFLSGDNFTLTAEADGSLLFMPENGNGHGIVIMHGALIMPQSYAKTGAFFAQKGYTVYLPYGVGRLSITAIDKAAERLHNFSVKKWFFIGHSMGGMSSLELISRHKVNAAGVALWAAGMPADYSKLKTPMLYIWADTDGLIPAERFRQGKKNLPDSVEYITLEGANHKNFAMYSHQFFDFEATIDWMEQIDFANEATAEFFSRQLEK